MNLFLTDIDGTLLDKNHQIPEDITILANEYVKRGNLFTICSGRSILSTQWISEVLHLTTPAILLSGSMIYDFDTSKILYEQPMNSEVFSLIEFIYQKYPNFAIQAFTKDEVHAIRNNDILVSKGVREERRLETIAIDDLQDETLFKLLVVGTSVDDVIKCKEESDKLFDDFHFEFSGGVFAEVVSKKSGKFNALVKLLQIIDNDVNHVLYAGDGLTDLKMIQEADYSFAPENAHYKVLESCDLIIPSNKNGGMREAFKELMGLE